MSWEMVKLGDIFKITSGGTPSRKKTEYYEGGNIHWIKTGDLHNKYINSASEFITENGLASSSTRIYPKGTVLLAMYGATIGACSILNIEACTNQACAAFVPNDNVDTEYLYYLLRFNKPNFVKAGSGGAQPNISASFLKNFEIPLPPLDEQKRIAAILDKADAIRQKRKQAIALADDFLRSVFLDMFGDPVTNPKGWEVKKLGELCGVGSSKRVFVDEFVATGIPFYRGTEVGALGENEEINPHLFISKSHYENLIKHSGKPNIGDLLLPSICHDGRIWKVNHSEPFYFKDGRVLWIKNTSDKLTSDYLKSYLKRYFLTNYSNIASGTTFAELKIVSLKNLDILLPDIDLQRRYTEVVEICSFQLNKKKNSLILLEEQFNALSQKAFSGQL